jgi:septal ring factor EnvC (AmiA/AmiB activator)
MMDETFDVFCACERTFRVASTDFRARVDGDPSASDFATCLAQAQAKCAVDISNHLGKPVALDGASVDTIRAEFARQMDQVSDVLKQRAALDEELARAENINARLESEMALSKAQDSARIAGLQAQIGLYERSLSWRLTAPLRALRQFGRASNPE